MNKNYTCCLCGDKGNDYGNNPEPLKKDIGKNRCCDECNWKKVIPARLKLVKKQIKEEKARTARRK